MAEMGRKEARARLEMSEDRAFALTHRVATLEARERDLQELLIAHRERVARLEAERDFSRAELGRLEAERDRLQRRTSELEASNRERIEELAGSSRALAAAEEQARKSREAVQALERDRSRLEASYDRTREQLHGLRSSRSYRVMQRLWSFNAAIKRPFRRRERATIDAGAPGEAAELPAPQGAEVQEPAAPSATGKGPGPKPEPKAPTAATIGDREHERWLSRAAQGPLDTRELRVAAIVDEISRACFEPDCELVTFGPDGWRQSLEEAPPHLLLVESTWQGNGGSWQYQVASYDHPELRRPAAAEGADRVVPGARHPDRLLEQGGPGPLRPLPGGGGPVRPRLHHGRELHRRLRQAGPGGDRRDRGAPFAAQPRIHNPIAGAGRAQRLPLLRGRLLPRPAHPDRRRSLEMLLDAARPYDLVIYDRTAGSRGPGLRFPRALPPLHKGASSLRQRCSRPTRPTRCSSTSTPSPTRRRCSRAGCSSCSPATRPCVSTESLGVAETFGDLVTHRGHAGAGDGRPWTAARGRGVPARSSRSGAGAWC